MREKQQRMKTAVWDWLMLIVAALLLALSLWTLSVEYPRPLMLGGLLNRPELAVRQGLLGLPALALAIGVGRLLPSRQMLRLWWLPLPLFALMLIAIPVSSWAKWAVLIKGSDWWQRSPGWIAGLLVTISGLTFALPRLVRADSEDGAVRPSQAPVLAGMAAFAGTLLFAATWPTVSSFALLFVLSGVVGMSVFVVLRGCRRWVGLMAAASVCGLALSVLSRSNPRLMTSLLARHTADYHQAHQAQLAIHAGGWTGSRVHPPMVPDWETDFIFSRACNVGGLLGGTALLVLVGLLLTLAWRIVARQGRPAARALASGCAAVLTVRALLHLTINSGLWPLMPMPMPFLSYGPVLLLFDGVLLGVLMALDRERDELAPPQDRTTRRSSLQDGLADGAPADQALFRPETSCSMPRRPVLPVQIGIWIVLAIFMGRLYWLVSGDHSIRRRRAEGLLRIEAREQERNRPVRGRILDVQGRVLARHGVRHVVFADPQLLDGSPDRHLHADLLRLIGLDAVVFERRTSDPERRYVRLATVPEGTAEAVRRMRIRGFGVHALPSRDHPLETPLTHLAGFVNHAMQGGSGVEQARHALLETGQDVRLTLYADLQAAAQAIAEYHAAAESRTAGGHAPRYSGSRDPADGRGGLAAPALPSELGAGIACEVQIVVVNPRTGAIRAAAQIPATHGSLFPSADPRALTWRGNMDLFEPGGLVQPLVIASALERGVIASDSLIETDNGLWIHHDVPLRDRVPRAAMTPTEILTLAGNIGMAKIGLLLGENALHESLVKWGLNTPAATCVPGAGRGILPEPDRWSRIESTRLPIGQGHACTLMQMVRAYTAFFNDGRIVEPYLVEDAASRSSGALSAPLSAATAAQVREMLERVVADGTGRAAGLDGVTVFGKTAVVQRAVPGGYEDRFQSLFVGGFEREKDEPVLMAVRLTDLPGATQHEAAAVFRRVAEIMLGDGIAAGGGD